MAFAWVSPLMERGNRPPPIDIAHMLPPPEDGEGKRQIRVLGLGKSLSEVCPTRQGGVFAGAWMAMCPRELDVRMVVYPRYGPGSGLLLETTM